jgi:hypothetical protein
VDDDRFGGGINEVRAGAILTNPSNRLQNFLHVLLEERRVRIFHPRQPLRTKHSYLPVNACIKESAFVNQLPLTLRSEM